MKGKKSTTVGFLLNVYRLDSPIKSQKLLLRFKKQNSDLRIYKCILKSKKFLPSFLSSFSPSNKGAGHTRNCKTKENWNDNINIIQDEIQS